MRVELANGLWRPMTEADLPAVCDIADRVHVSYPEDDTVFAERLRIYPAGCAVFEPRKNARGSAPSRTPGTTQILPTSM